MKEFEPPAELPAPLREQLKALAPYMQSFSHREEGGFIIEMSVPTEIITKFDTNFLVQHGITVSATFEPPEVVFGGRMVRPSRYVDIILEYG